MSANNSSIGQNQTPGWVKWLAGAQIPSVAVAEIFGLPSTILYAIEVIMMGFYWRRHFNNTFYVFFIVRALSDLVCTVNTYLNSRFGLLGIGAAFYQSLPTLVLGLLQMSNYFTYGLSNLATILMSLNRLTAITMPLRYNQVWNKYMPYILVFIVLFPFGYTVRILWLHMFANVNPITGTWGLLYTERVMKTETKYNDLFVASMSGMLYMLICLALNIAIVVKLRAQHILDKQAIQQNEREKARRRKVENRLTLYAIFTFVGHFVHASYIFIKYIIFYQLPAWNIVDSASLSDLSAIIANVQNIVGDFDNAFLPSWLMFWANRELRALIIDNCLKRPRDALMRLFGCRAPQTTTTTSLFVTRTGNQNPNSHRSITPATATAAIATTSAAF